MRLTFMAGEFTRSNDVETSTDIRNASVDMSTSSPWKKFSPLHVNLRDVLLASTTLHPEHVDVRNESYLYANREKLKPKRLMHFITKAHCNNGFESYIWEMKPREKDHVYIPQKHFLSSHKSRWSAYKQCEIACAKRDGSPGEQRDKADKILSSQIMNTHFKILIVSSEFDRLNAKERMELVYEELLDSLGENLQISGLINQHNLRCNQLPSRMKILSYFGPSVRKLRIFRFLLLENCTLIIETKTPSQWKPQKFAAPRSERYGSSHLSFNSVHLPQHATGGNCKLRVKQLAVDLKRDPQTRLTSLVGNSGSSSSSSSSINSVEIDDKNGSSRTVQNTSMLNSKFNPDDIGVNPLVSGMQFPDKKKGGIYGHFFHDLPAVVKELVINRYVSNKRMIQEKCVLNFSSREQAKGKNHLFQPKTTIAMLEKKMEKARNIAAYDKGTDHENDMVEEVFIFAKTIDRWAIPLQRMWRIRLLNLAKRNVWRRCYAVLMIQKSLRAAYGRRYVKLQKRLAPLAVSRIQKCWMMLLSRKRTTIFQSLVFKISRVILPKMKRFLKACYESWIWKRSSSSVMIQSSIMMYSCKVRRIRRAGEIFFIPDHFHDAVTCIQKMYRGYKGRCSLTPLIEKMLIFRVDNPAARCIQRIYRGKVGKNIARRRQLERDKANIVQGVVKYYLHRCWRRDVLYSRLRYNAAECVQRVFRGRLDRVLVKRLEFRRWYHQRFVPAVIKVQTWGRMICVRRHYSRMRLENEASGLIQGVYRYYMRKKKALIIWRDNMKEQRSKIATEIQKIWRGKSARMLLRRMSLTYSGRRVSAAKTILKAWINFKLSKIFAVLLENHRAEYLIHKLERLIHAWRENNCDREEILLDIDNLRRSMAVIKERLKVISRFKIEAEVRANHVAQALQGLEPEDFERGWAEAYGQEFESLQQMLAMSVQEERCLKVKHNKQKCELLELFTELEDAEIDDDELAVIEMNAYETLHRAQVISRERKIGDHRNRSIRLERCKWAIDANRLQVIRGKLEIKAEDTRSIEYATTLSYEKRAKQWDFERIVIDDFCRDQRTKIEMDAVKYDYRNYARSVQQAYGNVVSNTLSILRCWGMDEKAKYIRESTEKKAKNVPVKGEFQALKKDGEFE